MVCQILLKHGLKKWGTHGVWVLGTGFIWILALGLPGRAEQLVQADIPEEILQVQVDETAYSKLDGTLRSTSAYAQEKAELQIKPENVPGRIAPDVRQIIDLLRIRKAILQLIPFR